MRGVGRMDIHAGHIRHFGGSLNEVLYMTSSIAEER